MKAVQSPMKQYLAWWACPERLPQCFSVLHVLLACSTSSSWRRPHPRWQEADRR